MFARRRAAATLRLLISIFRANNHAVFVPIATKNVLAISEENLIPAESTNASDSPTPYRKFLQGVQMHAVPRSASVVFITLEI